MTFTPADPSVPTSIGPITIIMSDPTGVAVDMTIRYALEVLDDDGNAMSYPHTTGNLEPHLTAGQKQALVDFMNDMRLLAVSEIIP